MAKINDVDIDKIKAFGEQLKIDATKTRRTQVVEGEWLIKGGRPQLLILFSWKSFIAFGEKAPSFQAWG